MCRGFASLSAVVVVLLVGFSSLYAQVGWYPVMNGIPTDSHVRCFWFVSETNGVAAGDFGDAFRTADGGKNWQKFNPSQDPHSLIDYSNMQFFGSDVGYLWGFDQGQMSGFATFKTIDGGNNWIRLGQPLPEFGLRFSESVMFGAGISAEQGSGDPVIYDFLIQRSSDMGLSWSDILNMKQSPGLDIVRSNVVIGDTLQFILEYDWGNGPPIVRSTTDGGLTWSDIIPYTRLAADIGSGKWVGVNLHDTLFQSTDISKGWNATGTVLPFTDFYPFGDGNTAFASLADSLPFRGAIAKTTDFGNNWSFEHVQNGKLRVVSLQQIDKQAAYLLNDSGTIYKTTTGGELSVPEASPSSTGIEVYPNPAKDIVHIQFNCVHTSDRVLIYDLLGRIIRARSLATQEPTLSLDVRTLQTGVYLVRAGSSSSRLTTER